MTVIPASASPLNSAAGEILEIIRFAIGECSLGCVLVAATNEGICAIDLGDSPDTLAEGLRDRFPRAQLLERSEHLQPLVAQVVEQIEQPGRAVDLPLCIRGTSFQQMVWHILRRIPAGQTLTYAEVAAKAGCPASVRAVASAIAANKLAVAIPCHRVVRTGGALSGYRWGVERKAALLKRERAL